MAVARPARVPVRRAPRAASGRRRSAAAAAAKHRAAIHEAVLDRHHVEQPRRGAERRRHPVRGAAYRRARRHAVLVGRVAGHQLRTSVRADAARPRELLHEGPAEQHFSIRAIEHVEEAVAIRLQQQLARLPLEHRIDEHRWLLRVPIPQIVRRELIVPAQLSGLRVEREDGIRVQVVALPLAAVGVRIRISRRPEQRVGLGVVGPGQPRRAAALFEIDAPLPRIGRRLAAGRHGPETPGLLAGVDAVRREEPANAFVTARHAGDDEIADDERRHGAAVGQRCVFRQHDFPQQRAVDAADRKRDARCRSRETRATRAPRRRG